MIPITYISSLIIPFIVLTVIIYGIYKKINVYDVFIEGVKEGIDIGISIFPYILGMVFAVSIFTKSDGISIILYILNPIINFFSIPKEIIPLAILRPISGSSSIAFLNDLFIKHGPDSYIGNIASVIQASTDTTFYIVTLYFGSIGIKKIKHALYVGVLVDLISVITAIILVTLFLK